jgi:hypothetical protein
LRRTQSGAGTAPRRFALVSKARRQAAHAEAEAMPHVEDDRIVETKTEARAGVTGHGVRGMLIGGVTAVVVLFVIVFLIFFA